MAVLLVCAQKVAAIQSEGGKKVNIPKPQKLFLQPNNSGKDKIRKNTRASHNFLGYHTIFIKGYYNKIIKKG